MISIGADFRSERRGAKFFISSALDGNWEFPMTRKELPSPHMARMVSAVLYLTVL
jgi:hypothetical protein